MKLKELIIDWLTESRYIRALEKHLDTQRSDFLVRLAEKDTLLRGLRIEFATMKAENERMRLVLMPLGSSAGQVYSAKFQSGVGTVPVLEKKDTTFEGPLDWQGELNKMLQEEEDGILDK